MEPILNRIGFMQVLVLIEGFDMEDLHEKSMENQVQEHHVIKSPSALKVSRNVNVDISMFTVHISIPTSSFCTPGVGIHSLTALLQSHLLWGEN